MIGRVRVKILIILLARMYKVGILKVLLMLLRHFWCGVKREASGRPSRLHLCAKTTGPQNCLLLVLELQEVLHEW